MGEKLRINFVLPPIASITGGPLAILEYANRLLERGHDVSITTYPKSMWSGRSPFPWFDFKGTLCYAKTSEVSPSSALQSLQNYRVEAPEQALFRESDLQQLRLTMLNWATKLPDRTPLEFLSNELTASLQLITVMPDCDINVATFWTTVFPVYFSRKGKPVYFMQHYEEIFYDQEPSFVLQRLAARMSYELPMYKIANSSWLKRQIKERYGQDIPFSNNAIVVSDFSPQPKKSLADGVIRVVTYAQRQDWKGFADAAAAMAIIRTRYGSRVEWDVFGYDHPAFPENNVYAPYAYHPKLSFAELAKLYATSDIALCPSWYESFPLPPLEAMASGTAVVTTSEGVEDYAFHERNALLVPPRGTEQMAAAVARLIEDEPLRNRLAEQGRETAETFTWDRAVDARERMLLDVHQGRLEYDRWKPSELRLIDGAGIPFEQAPADLQTTLSGLFWKNGNLYLAHHGTKRQIRNLNVVPLLTDQDMPYVTLNNLEFSRMPSGPSIWSEIDIDSVLTASHS